MPIAAAMPALAKVEHNLSATPSITPGTVVTGSATPHTKGSWASLLDPVSFDTHFVAVGIFSTGSSATRTDALIDIGYGPTGGGSEQVILPDLLAGWTGSLTSDRGVYLYLPLFIPKGVRVSARLQGLQASKTARVVCYLYGGASRPMPSFKRADAIGVTGASSTGTTMDSPLTAGTESSWVNVGSATSRPYGGLAFMCQGTLSDTTTTALAYHFEIGVSSTTFMEFLVGSSSTENSVTFPAYPYLGQIPTGSQLQCRVEQSGTDTQDLDVALYGLY